MTGRVARWAGRWSLRARLATAATAAVVVAVALVSVTAWLVTARTLRAELDRSLVERSLQLPGTQGPRGPRSGATPPGPLDDGPEGDLPRASATAADPEYLCARTGPVPEGLLLIELVRADGTFCTPPGQSSVPPAAADVAAAAGGTATGPRDARTGDGVRVRVIARPIGDGYAVLLARETGEVDSALNTLGLVLVAVGVLGSLGALAAGWTVARAGLRPVGELTRTAEHVAATQELDVPVPVRGSDELARLATAFNAMTAALAADREAQHRMVADAGHELRTPLTSLRTNIELLLRAEQAGRAIPAEDRSALLADVSAQLAELTGLVAGLDLLAGRDPGEVSQTRLDHVVAHAVERVRRRGERRFDVELAPWVVRGDAQALERAVVNVLDNAVKFSPAGSTVTVRLGPAGDGTADLCVDDEGDGIAPADLPHVFERFWRAPRSRSRPGSGLGLAIVAETVREHDGSVTAGASPAGGARVRLRLPGRPVRPHA